MTNSYFELFGIKESCFLDEQSLKKSYYQLSRRYHPDLYALRSEDEKSKAAQMSELVNIAYTTLADKESRIQYILKTNGFMNSGDNGAIDQEFLMEMMEINEGILILNELKSDSKAYNLGLKPLKSQIDKFENELEELGNQAMHDFDLGDNKEDALLKVKTYYLKLKYLRRIIENLEGQTSL
jgi:molecular chaperone HscB